MTENGISEIAVDEEILLRDPEYKALVDYGINKAVAAELKKIYETGWYYILVIWYDILVIWTGPHSAVGNVSGYRCVSNCRSRSRVRSRCNRPEFPPSQFFPRGKNGPAHSFPTQSVF